MANDASAFGLHRALVPNGVLPQMAEVVDASPSIGDDEVLLNVTALNLDATSFDQLLRAAKGDGDAVRTAVLEIIRRRGKMHNPVTGSGGILLGCVAEVGDASPLGLKPGDKVATLHSLTATPLHIDDDLREWNGLTEQIPTRGHAVLFARSLAAVLPDDLDEAEVMAVFDVCGAPALTARVLETLASPPEQTSVLIIGGGKSAALSAAAAARLGCEVVVTVPTQSERDRLQRVRLPADVLVADATDPLATRQVLLDHSGGLADVTVVCVNRPGCEHAAILATRDLGTVIYFSMATHFPAAALGAESVAADVTMLIGSGFVPGHAEFSMQLYRESEPVQQLFREIR
jgi:L-erythro-3,5-diaminohexanoate dehydrogenase